MKTNTTYNASYSSAMSTTPKQYSLEILAVIFSFIAAIFFFGPAKASGPAPVISEILPYGLVFRIESSDKIAATDPAIIDQFAPVTIYTPSEFGAYTDFIAAQKAKNLLKEKGYDTTEIIAYFNHNRISIDDAFTLINNRNKYEQAGIKTISVEAMDSLLGLIKTPDFYFAINFSLASAKDVNTFFNLSEKIEIRVTPGGDKVYVFGKFSSKEDAEVYLELLKASGLAEASLSAWDKNNQQIPVDRAFELEFAAQQAKNNEMAVSR